MNQIKKYANHENADEITGEIFDMLWIRLSDWEQEEFQRVANDENPLKDAYDKVNEYIRNDDFESALEYLDSFFLSFNFGFQDNDLIEYHTFLNIIEKSLFDFYFDTYKRIRYIPEYLPYVEIHYLYAVLLIEFGRFDEADDILDNVLRLNPVSTHLLFEKCEIFKFRKDLESLYECSIDILKYAYLSEVIGKAYRNLGFYFTEKEDYEAATALYSFSLSFDFSQEALSAIKDIQVLGYDKPINENRILEILYNNNIQLGYDPHILNIISDLIREEKSKDDLIGLYNILYDLTKDEDILKKLNKLNEN